MKVDVGGETYYLMTREKVEIKETVHYEGIREAATNNVSGSVGVSKIFVIAK